MVKLSWVNPPFQWRVGVPIASSGHLQGAGVRSAGADVQRRAQGGHGPRVGAPGAAAETQLAVLDGGETYQFPSKITI